MSLHAPDGGGRPEALYNARGAALVYFILKPNYHTSLPNNPGHARALEYVTGILAVFGLGQRPIHAAERRLEGYSYHMHVRQSRLPLLARLLRTASQSNECILETANNWIACDFRVFPLDKDAAGPCGKLEDW